MRYTLGCGNCKKEFEVGCTLKEFEAHRSGKKKIRCPICRSALKMLIDSVRFKIA